MSTKPMHRVIAVEVDPHEYRGPDATASLPPDVEALGEDVVSIIEYTGEGTDNTSCECGVQIGLILNDADDTHPSFEWGSYAIWADSEGRHVRLCAECDEREAELLADTSR